MFFLSQVFLFSNKGLFNLWQSYQNNSSIEDICVQMANCGCTEKYHLNITCRKDINEYLSMEKRNKGEVFVGENVYYTNERESFWRKTRTKNTPKKHCCKGQKLHIRYLMPKGGDSQEREDITITWWWYLMLSPLL